MIPAYSHVEKTNQQYREQVALCKDLFLKKAKDYGTSWTILRMPSLTDQIFIKAERIHTLEEKKVNKVGESITGEYIGIVNYCVIALMLLEIKERTEPAGFLDDLALLEKAYERMIEQAYSTLQNKNHDYGEAWRMMRITSLTDLIRMKIERLKQIEDSDGKLLVSEGVDANYIDIINYAIFALIRLQE